MHYSITCDVQVLSIPRCELNICTPLNIVCECVCKRVHAVIPIKASLKVYFSFSLIPGASSFLLRREPPSVSRPRPDGGNRQAPLPRQVESDALLVVGRLVDEERIERLFAFVPQRFP